MITTMRNSRINFGPFKLHTLIKYHNQFVLVIGDSMALLLLLQCLYQLLPLLYKLVFTCYNFGIEGY